MSPRPLPGVVFITGVVFGSIVSFIGIQMLSSSSSVLVKMDNTVSPKNHLVREIDVELLCNISRKSARMERAGQSTDSPILDKQRLTRDSEKDKKDEKDEKDHRSPPISHDEVVKQVESTGDVHFADEHHHNDQTEVARNLAKNVRILCWVMTAPENHKTRATLVQETWGKRCDKLLFVSEREDKSLTNLTFLEVSVSHGREHLTAKTMTAFDHLFEHHMDDADWFIKADDDTFVIVENLKYFLSSQNKDDPVFFGHHFKTIVKQGYFSGGGGYVLSKEALRRFGSRPKGSCREDQGAEDAEMGKCMEMLGVRTGDSRDRLGRSRFHCFNPETHVHGGYPDWYFSYDKYGAQKGIESISDYAITFHYISIEQMQNLEFYIYHLRPYGIISGLQDLNQIAGKSPEVSGRRETPKPT